MNKKFFSTAVAALVVIVAAQTASPQMCSINPREPLVDLFASESISRIDFISTTFDGALQQIETAVDTMLEASHEAATPSDETVRILADVVRGLDGFEPRRDGYNFSSLSLVILDDGDARQLGRVAGMTTVLISEDPASRAAPQAAARSLFRGVTLDSEEGISPLEQLLHHVEAVAAMPKSERGRFLR